MTTIRRFAGTGIPPYFLGRPRRMYEGRYEHTAHIAPEHVPMPMIVPRLT